MFTIKKDGTWYYKNSFIQRPALVNLFSTILVRDAQGYWLKTPVEKIRVDVEDAPFIAVSVEFSDPLLFTLNTTQTIPLTQTHPLIRIKGIPYLTVKSGEFPLLARINSATYYHLVEKSTEMNENIGVWSNGEFFNLS